MIQSLNITDYKVFGNLVLPDLSRVNLVVGENNTGKSCLLEAIGLYSGRRPIQDVLDVVNRRSNEKIRFTGASAELDIQHPVFSLFRRTTHGLSEDFTISQDRSDANTFRMSSDLFARVEEESGIRRLIPMSEAQDTVTEAELAVLIERSGRRVGLISARTFRYRSSSEGLERLPGEFATVMYLPANGLSNEDAAKAWDELVRSDKQELVLDCMRLIESRVQDIVYVGDRFASRTALVKVKGESPIPLRSLGDGLTRAFHLGMMLASASGGVLLIDEFENGLHWRTQGRLWRVIFESSAALDVQVFVSTHSRDTIAAFAAAAREQLYSNATVHRLEKDQDAIRAVALPTENVEASVRVNAEIR